MNITLKLDKKALLGVLGRYRILIVTLIVVALAGYTVYQISLITSISPDEATVTAERAQIDAARIKFDTATIQAITKQTQVTTSSDLSKLGKTDPFYQ